MIKISCDKSKLNQKYIHSVLSGTYWANERSREQVQESINNSLCFGMYLNDKQIGFARVVTDRVIFSYLMDFFIDEEYRGSGYGKKLIVHIYQHDHVIGVKNNYLHTKDAQPFYHKFGFEEYEFPDRFMLKNNR